MEASARSEPAASRRFNGGTKVAIAPFGGNPVMATRATAASVDRPDSRRRAEIFAPRRIGMKNPAESDTLRQLQSLLQSELGAMKIYREASRSVRGGDIERRLAAIARQRAA